MRYRFLLLLGLLSAMAVSCEMDELPAPEGERIADMMPDVIYATIDDQAGNADTRTFADEKLRVLWNSDDRITLYNDYTYGFEYKFSGEDGASSGKFDKIPVSDDLVVVGEHLNNMVYSVYPHRTDTEINPDGIISVTLPAEQAFQKSSSFGKDANVMVSKAEKVEGEGIQLRFKNVGGYLSFKLYGDNVTVSSIILKGNNGEQLAGRCSVDMSDGLPKITSIATATDEVKLKCDNVVLGTSSTDYTEFWFVLPPVEFSEAGFTLIVTTTDGGVYSRGIPLSLTIERNGIKRLAPIKVVPVDAPADLKINEIYTTRPTAKDQNYKYTADYSESEDTYTITIPTLTDFAHVVLNYSLKDGDKLLYNGEEIESGATPVDASSADGAKLVLLRGYHEKQFTLKAQNTGLPVVKISTTGFTREDVESDQVHKTIWRPTDTEDPSTGSATISVYNSDGTLDCTTDIQIKGRGNATWGYPKRPYALKFPKKKAVLKMAEHKRWILLANWKDRTLLRNDAAFWLSKQVSDVIKAPSFPYTVKGEFVELEFNGEHRGNYYLCEQIKINKKRVNITEMDPLETDPFKVTGGYLMEIDNNWDDDNSFWSGQYPKDPANPAGQKTDIGGFNFKFQFKEPDEEDRSNEAYYYMTKFIAEFEEMIKKIPNGNMQYRDYFDMESAIWFMFINELTSNGDFYNENFSATYKGPHSTYLYKDRDVLNEDGSTTVSKIHMGPIWDFDYLTFMPSRSNKWAGIKNGNTYVEYYYKYLLSDPVFCNLMLDLWKDYKSYFSGLPTYIEEMARKIRLSDQFDAEMWWDTKQYGNADQDQNGELNMDFDQAVENIKSGFSGKWTFMDNNLSKLPRVSLQ